MSWMIGGLSPGRGWEFSHHCVQTGSMAHSASYPLVPGAFPGGIVAGAWSWPLTSI